MFKLQMFFYLFIFLTSLQNYLSKSWNYTNLFIWIRGPWTPWRSLVSRMKRGRQSSVGTVLRRQGSLRATEKAWRRDGAWPGNLPSASHSSYADRHTTWRTRIVGRRARIQRRTRRT